MTLLAVITFPGWRLRSTLNERMHWAVRRRASTPPCSREYSPFGINAVQVDGPHKQRTIVVTRYGPKKLDKDNLYAACKPVVDRLKFRRVMGHPVAGYVLDDSDAYCRIICEQEPHHGYGVIAKVYED